MHAMGRLGVGEHVEHVQVLLHLLLSLEYYCAGVTVVVRGIALNTLRVFVECPILPLSPFGVSRTPGLDF